MLASRQSATTVRLSLVVPTFSPVDWYSLRVSRSYRIHLSPGSRRSSARSAASRSVKRGATASATASSEPPSAPPPLSSPPPLEQARAYNHNSTPPDSPPPLAQATLPATATLPNSNPSRLSSASPDFTSGNSHHLVPLGSQAMGMAPGAMNYNYRSGTTTYQEQSQGAGYTYVHTTPVSGSSTNGNNGNGNFSYSNGGENFNAHSQSASTHNRDNSPVSMSSRHSISHISHPQSYSQAQSSSAGPPSPASSHSVSSHTSGPPTPTYPVFHDEPHPYHHGNGMITDHSGMNNGHINTQSHMVHNGYSSNGVHQSARFDSPPPTLAPIQDERLIRREEARHSHSHNASPYIHHPQPLSTEYPYHQSMALGHGAWKADGSMRKGVSATLV